MVATTLPIDITDGRRWRVAKQASDDAFDGNGQPVIVLIIELRTPEEARAVVGQFLAEPAT